MYFIQIQEEQNIAKQKYFDWVSNNITALKIEKNSVVFIYLIDI